MHQYVNPSVGLSVCNTWVNKCKDPYIYSCSHFSFYIYVIIQITFFGFSFISCYSLKKKNEKSCFKRHLSEGFNAKKSNFTQRHIKKPLDFVPNRQGSLMLITPKALKKTIKPFILVLIPRSHINHS